MPKIAIAQVPPVVLNRTATIAKAVETIREAATRGVELIVFPEAFIPGYPAWIWRLKPGGDWGLSEEIHARLADNAIDLSTDHLQPLFDAARESQMTIVCGVNELDHETSRATLYNSVLTIGPKGTLLNRHRKLMPTNPERMVWGFGDASGLEVVETPAGRVGALVCWENFMPLARYALYAQGIEIYVAPTYDQGDGWIGTLQHIAREGCCWVLGAGAALRVADLPEDFPNREILYPPGEQWINGGDSVVIAPGGRIVTGPMHEELGLLVTELDLTTVRAARRSLDVVGHYARPDIFTLHVDRRTQRSVETLE